MSIKLDPKSLGLSSRDHVEKLDDGRLALIIHRKSRIIMADGRRLLEKVRILRSSISGADVTIRTSAPVCSKTRAFLEAHDVSVEEI